MGALGGRRCPSLRVLPDVHLHVLQSGVVHHHKALLAGRTNNFKLSKQSTNIYTFSYLVWLQQHIIVYQTHRHIPYWLLSFKAHSWCILEILRPEDWVTGSWGRLLKTNYCHLVGKPFPWARHLASVNENTHKLHSVEPTCWTRDWRISSMCVRRPFVPRQPPQLDLISAHGDKHQVWEKCR